MEDRLTTTSGGMERIEVRLSDVVERAHPRPGPRRPVADRPVADRAPVGTPGTIVIPLTDLQALFTQVGDAQKRAAEAMARAADLDGETRRLAGQLARAEAGLAKARADLEDERRRARQRDAAEPRPRLQEADGGESEARRAERARAEARLTEARREVSALRRRVQELEAAAADAPEAATTAERAVERLQAELARAANRTTRLRQELEQQHRRIAELEGVVQAYEALPVGEPPGEPVGEPLGEPVGEPAAGAAVFDAEEPGPFTGAWAEDRFARVIDPPPPEEGTGRPSPRSSDGPRPLPPLKPALQRLLGSRANGARHPRPHGRRSDRAEVAEDLRHLYSQLQGRSRGDAPGPAESHQWLADLAAYDEALVRACREFGVPTGYPAGARLPAEARVALSRALAEAGLDVRA